MVCRSGHACRSPDIDVSSSSSVAPVIRPKARSRSRSARANRWFTANKALLAKHGIKLAALAERKHVALNFEAAVGGAIPIIKTLREGMVAIRSSGSTVSSTATCNYILTRMSRTRCRSRSA